jgi:chromosome segregation ATPase
MQATDTGSASSRSRRNNKEKSMSQIDKTKAQLDTHEAICAERYANITDRFVNIEVRFDRIETDIREIKDSTQSHFDEIKRLISNQQSEKLKTMFTVAGTIIVGLLGVMGYLITHLPG